MRSSIQLKLTLTLLGVIACLLLSTLFLAQRSFSTGFADYIDELERRRLTQLATHVATLYTGQPDEPWPAHITQRFEALSHMPATPRGASRRLDAPRRPPPMRMPPGQAGPHPTALQDLYGAHIAGDRLDVNQARSITVPVFVEGRPVASISSQPRLTGTRQIEQAIVARQIQNMTWITLVSMAIAILISVLLGRQLLLPIKRLQRDVARLSSGNYDLSPSPARADEIGLLTRDVSRLADTLRETRQLRRQMFANISHELRTPLTILSAEVEAIHDGVRALDLQAIDSIEQEVDRLRYLVDDLYDLSLSELGALSYVFEEHDLSTIVAQEIESLSMHELEGITLEVTLTSMQARVDMRRLQQLVRNVLSNAITYTDSPGHIRISLTHDQTHITLSISDSPPSVSIAECHKIFDPLFRTEDSEARRRNGAGLGLAICQKIAEAHHGSMRAEPSTLGGLHIIITLPKD